MDFDIKEQLISTIMKTFVYSKTQADYLFIQLMNCVSNKDLVGFFFNFKALDKQQFEIFLLFLRFQSIDLVTRKIKRSI